MKTDLCSSTSVMPAKESSNPRENFQRIGIPGRAIQHVKLRHHILALKKEKFHCAGAAERNSGGLAW